MYKKIKKLSEEKNILNLHSNELEALGKLWLEKKKELENSGEFKLFMKKMQREWAIETGIIERLYNWDRGVTETLIEHGIDASIINHNSSMGREQSEHIAKIIKDQENIVEGLFTFVKGEQPFSEYFIRSMHAELTSNQNSTDAFTPDGKLIQVPLIKGEYKKNPNNPKRPNGEIHEYCPPELVVEEMQTLVIDYNENEGSIPPEILSAWLHHRFTQIHPFQDGNGRIARALASLVFLKAGLFPLVIRDSDREEYISALEKADEGDLSSLVKLFVKRQRQSTLSALGLQQQVEQSKYTKQVIKSAINILKAKSSAKKVQLDDLVKTSCKLQQITFDKLVEIQDMLNTEIKVMENYRGDTYNAHAKEAKNGDKESHYFYNQIVEIANKHDYYVNTNQFRSWSRIAIFTEKIFEVVFSIHGYGHTNNGIMVVSGFTFEKTPTEEGATDILNLKPCNQDIFQFNYLESEENIIERYKEWLEESLTFALAEWQNTL